MGNPGYVYALINQSLPNTVKIGKTTKDPSIRASELSAATGVPTPFFVAFEAYFNDCDAAESYVHAFLESKGVRLAANREFFSVSPTVAINAIHEAQNKYGVSQNSNILTDGDDKAYNDDFLSELSGEFEEPWQSILDEAEIYDYGYGDYLQDYEKAIKLYKNAAKLGSSQAYIRLAELISETEGAQQGLEWLKRGADNNLPDCWLTLIEVFSGNHLYIEVSRNKENAIKCYRKYFGFVDSPLVLSDERGKEKMFFSFTTYLKVIGETPDQRDIEVSKVFVQKFRNILMSLQNEEGVRSQIKQLDDVVSKYLYLKI
jgi:hypothetical protein